MFHKRRPYVFLVVGLAIFSVGLVLRPTPPVMYEVKSDLIVLTQDTDRLPVEMLMGLSRQSSDAILEEQTLVEALRNAGILSDAESESWTAHQAAEWRERCAVDVVAGNDTTRVTATVSVIAEAYEEAKDLSAALAGILGTRIRTSISSAQHAEQLALLQQTVMTGMEADHTMREELLTALDEHFNKLEQLRIPGRDGQATRDRKQNSLLTSGQLANDTLRGDLIRQEIQRLQAESNRLQQQNHWTPVHPKVSEIVHEIEFFQRALTRIESGSKMPLPADAGQTADDAVRFAGYPHLQRNQFYRDSSDAAVEVASDLQMPVKGSSMVEVAKLDIAKLDADRAKITELKESLSNEQVRQQALLAALGNGLQVGHAEGAEADVIETSLGAAHKRLIRQPATAQVLIQALLAILVGGVVAWRFPIASEKITFHRIDEVRDRLGLAVVGQVRKVIRTTQPKKTLSHMIARNTVAVSEMLLAIVLVGLAVAFALESDLIELMLVDPFSGIGWAARELMGP